MPNLIKIWWLNFPFMLPHKFTLKKVFKLSRKKFLNHFYQNLFALHTRQLHKKENICWRFQNPKRVCYEGSRDAKRVVFMTVTLKIYNNEVLLCLLAFFRRLMEFFLPQPLAWFFFKTDLENNLIMWRITNAEGEKFSYRWNGE
jgi:hypothetical protein